jgi:hypothetical protein
MAWDSNRPVDYRRIFRDWLLIAGAMAVLIAVIPSMREGSNLASMIVSLVATLPIWFGLSWVMAKLGYQRKSLAELRAARAAAAAPKASGGATAAAAATERPRPAPTKRTSSGPSNRPQRKRR